MRFLMLVLGGFLVSQRLVAGTIECQKDTAEVYASADKSSAVLMKLKKGDSLTAGERNGMYWQVTTKSGQPGFVSVLAVKVKSESSAGLNDAMREAVKNGRAKSTADGGRTRSSVMGVRGLDDTKDVGMAAGLRPNLHAVYSMEDNEIAPSLIVKRGDIVTSEIESRMKNNN